MENGFKKSDVVPELLNLGCSIDYNEYELGNILSVHCGEIDFSIYFLTIVFGPVPGTEIHSVPLCKFSKKNLKNFLIWPRKTRNKKKKLRSNFLGSFRQK